MRQSELDLEARIERIEEILGTIVDLEAFDKKWCVLRANRLMILNTSGQMRAALTVNKHQDKGNGALYLWDRSGNLQASLFAVPDVGGQLSLFSPDELRKVAVGVDSTGDGRVKTFNDEVSSMVPVFDR
ncbi:hypothetical protein LLH00_03765 [bacterium]|nr:hypothetical protein [bacterium]